MRITIFRAGSPTTYHLNPNSVVGVRTVDVLNAVHYHLYTTDGRAFRIDRESYNRIVAWMGRR